MTSLISNYISKSYNFVQSWIPTILLGPLGVATVASAILDTIVYPAADALGNRMGIIRMPKLLTKISLKYSNIFRKTITEPLASRECDPYDTLHARLDSHPSRYPTLVTSIKKCLLNPPITTNFVGTFCEEVAFRALLTQTSGLTNVALIILSSTLFAAGHAESENRALQPGRLTALLATGLFLAVVTNATSFTTAVLTHILYNLLCWIKQS